MVFERALETDVGDKSFESGLKLFFGEYRAPSSCMIDRLSIPDSYEYDLERKNWDAYEDYEDRYSKQVEYQLDLWSFPSKSVDV